MDYNLCDINTIKRLLSAHGFKFSKSLGQNFLIDEQICPNMAEHLNADKNTGVIEIGAGIGVLTKELCKKAGKVCSVELDKKLYPILEETLGDYSNFELIEGDALKLDFNKLIEEHFNGYKTIKVCANLPYYITSPIIIKLLSEGAKISQLIVMVQQEAAERLTAEIGTRQAGAVSVAVQYFGKSEMLFNVGRESFLPQPRVDSAVIKISLYERPKYKIDNKKQFFSFVKGAFSQRRKTLINSLSSSLGFSKDKIKIALLSTNIKENSRAENLTMEEFVSLFNELYK